MTADQLYAIRCELAAADKRDRLRLVGTVYGSARQALQGWVAARRPTPEELAEYTREGAQ